MQEFFSSHCYEANHTTRSCKHLQFVQMRVVIRVPWKRPSDFPPPQTAPMPSPTFPLPEILQPSRQQSLESSEESSIEDLRSSVDMNKVLF
jgi:hypothetical protein